MPLWLQLQLAPACDDRRLAALWHVCIPLVSHAPSHACPCPQDAVAERLRDLQLAKSFDAIVLFVGMDHLVIVSKYDDSNAAVADMQVRVGLWLC